MKRYEFRRELSEKADKVYTDSSFVFFQDEEGTFYVADNSKAPKQKLGSLEDVEEYLLMFAEEDEE